MYHSFILQYELLILWLFSSSWFRPQLMMIIALIGWRCLLCCLRWHLWPWSIVLSRYPFPFGYWWFDFSLTSGFASMCLYLITHQVAIHFALQILLIFRDVSTLTNGCNRSLHKSRSTRWFQANSWPMIISRLINVRGISKFKSRKSLLFSTQACSLLAVWWSRSGCYCLYLTLALEHLIAALRCI